MDIFKKIMGLKPIGAAEYLGPIHVDIVEDNDENIDPIRETGRNAAESVANN